MAAPPTRRQAAQLAAVAVAGWAVARALRGAAPIGRDLRGSDAVATILDDAGSPHAGPATASVRLAVFTDYRCPACRRAFPALEAAVRADGDVRIVYKDWPIFGPASERAARVALASAAQGIYPAVHRALMRDGRTITEAMLRDVVSGAGGDWPRLVADRTTHAAGITARLRRNARQAQSIALPGTPAWLAETVLVIGAIDQQDFARLFAQARAATA